MKTLTLYRLILLIKLIQLINCQSLTNLCSLLANQTPVYAFTQNSLVRVVYRDVISSDLYDIRVRTYPGGNPKINSYEVDNTNPLATAAMTTVMNSFLFTSDMVQICSYNRQGTSRCGRRVPFRQYFDEWSNIARPFIVKVATATTNQVILIVEHVNTSEKYYLVYRLIGARYIIFGDPAYGPGSTSPSAMTASNNRNQQYIVFFGDYWAQVPGALLDRPLTLEKLLSDLQTNHQIRMSRNWKGCPVELCFEGDLDAATELGGGQFYFYRNSYRWQVELKNVNQPITVLGPATEITGFGTIEATQQRTGELQVFRSGMIIYYDDNGAIKKRVRVNDIYKGNGWVIPNAVDAIIDANQSNTWLFQGNKISVISNQSGILNLEDDIILATKWPGILKDIDAAVLTSVDEAILFKGSFHFRVKLTENGQSVYAMVNMNTLYTCSDMFYSQFAKLSITDIATFTQYIEKFNPSTGPRPPPSTVTPEVSTSSKPVLNSEQSTGGLSNGWIIALVLIAILVIVAIPLVYKYSSRKYDDNTVMFGETSTIGNETTAGLMQSPTISESVS